MPYSAGRMLAPKIAYSARNSAGRIYPSLMRISWDWTMHLNTGANTCEKQNWFNVLIKVLGSWSFIFVLCLLEMVTINEMGRGGEINHPDEGSP